MTLEASPELEAMHRARHRELGDECGWSADDSLDTGCPTRYRIYREAIGLPAGTELDDPKLAGLWTIPAAYSPTGRLLEVIL